MSLQSHAEMYNICIKGEDEECERGYEHEGECGLAIRDGSKVVRFIESEAERNGNADADLTARHLHAVPTDGHPSTRPVASNVTPLTGTPARTLGLMCTECESTFTDTTSALAHEAEDCSYEYDSVAGATYEIVTVQP